MKIRVLSDLHLEFQHWAPPKVDADVVALAGDIHVGIQGVEWARQHFAMSPVVYVPGNHEFYGEHMQNLFLHDPPEAARVTENARTVKGMTLREALRSYRFWVIAAAFFAVSLGISGLIRNMIAMLHDAGITAASAARVASFIGVGVIVARLSIGYVVDRMFAPVVGACVLLLTAAGCWLLAVAGPAVAMFAALLIGFAMGAEADLIAYLVSRYFGLRHFGVINGCGYAAYNAGAAFSPLLIGTLLLLTGTYGLALEIAAGLCTLAAVLLLTLGAYPAEPTVVVTRQT